MRDYHNDPAYMHRLAKRAFRTYAAASARHEIERAERAFAVVDRVNRLCRIAGTNIPDLPASLRRV
jgi:hypothetical protein